jgi:hypothetical protein
VLWLLGFRRIRTQELFLEAPRPVPHRWQAHQMARAETAAGCSLDPLAHRDKQLVCDGDRLRRAVTGFGEKVTRLTTTAIVMHVDGRSIPLGSIGLARHR